MSGKHEGRYPSCGECGNPEDAHPYRHPFRYWRPSENVILGPWQYRPRHKMRLRIVRDPLDGRGSE